MGKIAIIILNWNGYKDTIECLDSLLKSDQSLFDIIVVDNGSENESVAKIQNWFQEQKLELTIVEAVEVPKEYGHTDLKENDSFKEISSQAYSLVKSEKNLGFSAGNNLGIRYAMLHPYTSVMLLNNDTTLEPDAISKLTEGMESNPEWGACIPKIKYYDSPSIIWNAGGFLRPLGGRKYLYANETDNARYEGTRRVTFVTGCALVIRTKIVKDHGGLCEDFFFGEEDYELSKRYFIKKIQMFAVLDAVVYHKVGISRAKLLNQNALAYDFAHHLNRLIHMKRYMNSFSWRIWRFGSILYITFLLVVKKRVSISRKLVKYIRGLIRLSDQHSGIDQQLFLQSREIMK